MSAVEVDATYTLAPGYRLQWEEAQGCSVLLYPEGMVQLNETAATILSECCSGRENLRRSIARLTAEYGDTSVEGDVLEFMQSAHERRWIRAGTQ